MKKETYTYIKGEEVHLDEIYAIQGLAGGDWWEKVDGDEMGDDLIITRSIEITISWRKT